jgi:hypothetical protein
MGLRETRDPRPKSEARHDNAGGRGDGQAKLCPLQVRGAEPHTGQLKRRRRAIGGGGLDFGPEGLKSSRGETWV